MAAKSTYLSDAMLDAVLKDTAYTSPTTVYLALFDGDPATTGTEVSGGSYARQSAAFNTAASGSTTNSAAISFTGMPATTVNYCAIYDALTAGNLLYYASVTSLTINAGDTVSVAVAAITVTES